jgi:hypothetical protein
MTEISNYVMAKAKDTLCLFYLIKPVSHPQGQLQFICIVNQATATLSFFLFSTNAAINDTNIPTGNISA